MSHEVPTEPRGSVVKHPGVSQLDQKLGIEPEPDSDFPTDPAPPVIEPIEELEQLARIVSEQFPGERRPDEPTTIPAAVRLVRRLHRIETMTIGELLERLDLIPRDSSNHIGKRR